MCVKVSDGNECAVRRKGHLVRPTRMSEDIGGSLHGYVPHFYGPVGASGVKFVSISGKQKRTHRVSMPMQKSGGDFQPGKVPEPDRVIAAPAGQPQAIGRECQITHSPALARKVSEQATA